MYIQNIMGQVCTNQAVDCNRTQMTRYVTLQVTRGSLGIDNCRYITERNDKKMPAMFTKSVTVSSQTT